MGKNKKKRKAPRPTAKAKPAAQSKSQGGNKTAVIMTATIVLLAVVLFAVIPGNNDDNTSTPPPPTTNPVTPPVAQGHTQETPSLAATQTPSVGVPPMLKRPGLPTIDLNTLPSLEVNKAVMVTHELDFGDRVPTIAEALEQIERRSSPTGHSDRTFAILDAYGNATTNGKLHISMHVSTEKPGIGALVFKRTDEFLWRTQIVPGTNATKNFTGKDLTILISDGPNKAFTIDGSSNPTSILDANVRQLGIPLREIWKDGEEREMTYIYSACGCPVKVKCRRTGERTVRTSDMPVIFPDDPAVVQVITSLMRWE